MSRMPPRAFQFTPALHHDTYPYISPGRADLADTRVLISGASKGIGRTTAISFAQAGASHIALLARSDLTGTETAVLDAAKAAGKPRPKLLKIKCSTIDEQSVEAAARTVEEEFDGKLDILINNAGYLENWKAIVDADVKEWWYSYEVNVKGTMLMDKHFVPLLLKSRLKTVVVVTSAGGLNVSYGASGYQGSKTLQIRMNNYLMLENGEKGLLAFAIHPGGVKTELASNMPKHMHEILVDEPKLPGDSLVWLTKERREWLADRYVSVNWDMEQLLGMKDEIVEKDLLKLRLQV